MPAPPVVPTQSKETPAHAPSPPTKPTGVNRALYVMHRGDALRAQKHTCFYCYCPLTVPMGVVLMFGSSEFERILNLESFFTPSTPVRDGTRGSPLLRDDALRDSRLPPVGAYSNI
ncbi:hypothetical protein KBI52_21090 [Microvirga sp. HBU67558]|uniref:hypothetical protein n=1 Tax=Microvirga TaxID=186650 RepID=UPI001B382790|nr:MULTISPECIES: hypothetical protein [unclassified Microvirga]MBQ0822685.1 hypothetical protein [Microvirga sp. HBU67558]